MKKTISVIGANSYIARNLVYMLQQESSKYEVFLYDCTDNYIDDVEKCNYTKIDILSTESVKAINFDVDVVYMFVGKTGSANGFQDYNLFIDINERALLNVLSEYVRRKSSAKLVFPSTRLVYRGASGELDETAEKEYKTIYAINKYACEKYLEAFHNVYGVSYTIFRICVPYGTLIPGATSYGTAEFMLSKAKKNENITLYGDGAVRRTITYIEDLCRILIDGSFSEQIINDVFNVGGENYSLKEMAVLIARTYNVDVEMVEWPEIAKKIESGDTVFDSKKLDNILGHNYHKKFEDWIKQQ